jgi:acetamidase/formamidase
MSTFHLESTLETSINYFSPESEPVLTVAPGDTVVVHSLDASGYTEPQRTPGEVVPTLFERGQGHCLVGPIAVEGARPGQVLAVHLTSLRPDDWGWTASAAIDNPLNRALGLTTGEGDESDWLLWELDADRAIGTNQLGLSVALAPFLGVTGLPPAEPGRHSTVPPRTVGGGNIDCRELVAGSTLYLPITVPGAMLLIGDGHAAQGDGEVSGTAIECGMTTEFTLDLMSDAPLDSIHAVTPAGRITFGFDEDLNRATTAALDAMAIWMQQLYGIRKPQAVAMASVAVSMRVTQIANRTWGVHALLPHDAIVSAAG